MTFERKRVKTKGFQPVPTTTVPIPQTVSHHGPPVPHSSHELLSEDACFVLPAVLNHRAIHALRQLADALEILRMSLPKMSGSKLKLRPGPGPLNFQHNSGCSVLVTRAWEIGETAWRVARLHGSTSHVGPPDRACSSLTRKRILRPEDAKPNETIETKRSFSVREYMKTTSNVLAPEIHLFRDHGGDAGNHGCGRWNCHSPGSWRCPTLEETWRWKFTMLASKVREHIGDQTMETHSPLNG